MTRVRPLGILAGADLCVDGARRRRDSTLVTFCRQGHDRDAGNRPPESRLAADGDLHGAGTDSELGQPPVGAGDAIDPADDD
jgi:hypothetical protein